MAFSGTWSRGTILVVCVGGGGYEVVTVEGFEGCGPMGGVWELREVDGGIDGFERVINLI